MNFKSIATTLRNTIVVFACLSSTHALHGEDPIDFERDILPIFNESCVDCHGPEEQESAFRVDSRVALLQGGDYGEPAIIPGNDREGLLLKAIAYTDSDLEMPPDDKLADEQINLIRRWVKEGAYWPGQMDDKIVREKSDHWSFQPVVRPAVPRAQSPNTSTAKPNHGTTAGRTPIDAFLLERLEEEGLGFSDPADPTSLIRRASIVLTGLPPSPEQTRDFVNDYAVDSDAAYAELVERLLASPHFGERWAQHWLDVIRWAETNGSESNMYRKNAWIYRDYVIRSFNEDKPYDQFLMDQIAGDSFKQGDATGYLVSGPHVPLATVGREPTARRQARADRMDEILQTVGASALGVTIGCARCHNHKFDPISIKDYYSMAAVFEDIEFGSRFPEFGDDHPRRIRGKELYREINQHRRELREMGPWEEDWTGYREWHFPAVTTNSIRIKFNGYFVRLDELEVLGTAKLNENLADASRGVKVDYSEANTSPNMPIVNVNDGIYGNDGWMVSGTKNGKEKPWIQFTFEAPSEINRIRLSTNREDYLETDYLQKLNKQMYDIQSIEVLADDGQWTEVASPKQFAQSNKQHSERESILRDLHAAIDLANEEGPKPSFVGRRIRPSQTYILSRGSPENPGAEVFPAALAELGGDLGLSPGASGKERRKAFAEWIVAPENPLTARVIANRLWHHVFGKGIVTTTADFGAAGATPTHPELLDWLAAELVAPSEQALQSVAGASDGKKWSMKHLIRLMVMSDAFRQSSTPRADGIAVDAGSALLWRFPPRRVEAEVIRDSILQASAVLDRGLGGRSFRIHNVKERYAQWEIQDNYGPPTWRRMIYQERMRRVDDQMFTAFDFPDCGQVQAKRPVSTTPLQALNLMNSDFVIDQSKRVAQRAVAESGGDMRKGIVRCFDLLLTREPSVDELQACYQLAEQFDLSLVCRTIMNTNEFAFLP
ncbi:secreted protein containing DUF1549 [Rhodopirellula maiorica SM1]|uniref:Secreted protein containing DUF1549 n=1 Tax=Rhodopirellula maiorica SM1 TaxID=1265738 RepID=M5RQD0_9BACT|nr:PSD1 and planctomycete cytochrome C domain-containing protein [Rhodopirellula maiorica]EMI21500.1 secreted protein containing DUF1549 [Rhodopirellula maiorica SM1]